ncbi:MAG: preprotein translocase subunit SecA [Acidobacteriaceae bacterium]
MIGKALAKVFGTKNEREVKRLMPMVTRINAFEPEIEKLTDAELRAKTEEFRARIRASLSARPDVDKLLSSGTKLTDDETSALQSALDEVLPEAFAVVREAGKRVVNMRHFDVQLIGGMVLHSGRIAEMKTGEGKTLVATLPCYLNALAGRGVHVVTVNDYLAKRDAEWMGKIYTFLGLTVGVIVHDLSDEERKHAYSCDITYGTNNEFGFDYLRDNMKFDLKDFVQRGHYFAIVDEVDSILIDEARTPLIISGQSEESTDKYYKVNRIIPMLEKGEEIDRGLDQDKILTGDYVVDEKHKTISVTDAGWEKVEGLLGIGNIAEVENWDLKHHVETAIKAHNLYRRDVEYVVKDGEVLIVDEFTGRLMPGRRWSDGLHQSVEAKEGVKIERENQTLATITFQNYFRMFNKLSGMTGTAETEEAEFGKIYKLDIVVIPTNRKMQRKEFPDIVYRTVREKFNAVADEIAKLNETGQPVLVGTISIEKSEYLSDLLKKKGLKHVVRNAKYHEREAEIVAQAGRFGAVTIATNMAGRGTDILLGGNAEFMARQEAVKNGVARSVTFDSGDIEALGATTDLLRFYYSGAEYEMDAAKWQETFAKYEKQVLEDRERVTAAGGVHILGTERHESRRIDNQLRGRAGRQGDPGSSRFYLSLEDDLMRIFAKEWVSTLLQKLGMEEGVPIESGLITRRIEAAQKAVEAQHFEARKHVLEYDDVMNKQREAVYGLRRQLLEGQDQKEMVLDEFVADILASMIGKYAPRDQHPDQWDLEPFKQQIFTQFGVDVNREEIDLSKLNRQEIGDTLFETLKLRYDAKESLIGADQMRYHERMIMLSVLDGLWKDHLLQMDHLKEGIGLRGYAQHDPLVEYKKESFDLFEAMMNRFKEETARFLYLMQILDANGNDVMPPGSVVKRNDPSVPLPQASAVMPIAAPGEEEAEVAPERVAETVPASPPTNGGGRTSMDRFEKEFSRKKQRELEGARMAGGGTQPQVSQRRSGEQVGRNDPCPCGSGKKYKKCHGAEA